MTKIDLFGSRKSRGTFDDFYSSSKYNSLEEAYAANDYIECDFVKDENGVLFIEAKHVKDPELKKRHRLINQNPRAGLDIADDRFGCLLAESLMPKTDI